jgi:hypothetical protein
MSARRFEIIAKLIRMRGGAAQDAARLVLVDGLRPVDAARLQNISLQSVTNAVRRVKKADELVTLAASFDKRGAKCYR